MASKNDLIKSGEAGVYFREHPTRKNGVRKDRQWVIVQKLGDVRRVSTLGWWSAGTSLGDAINKAHEYRENFKWNKGNPGQKMKPICKQDEDDKVAALATQLELERKLEEHRNITFCEYFNLSYLPLQINNGKKSVKREQALFVYHLEPVLGSLTFHEIKPFHVEKVKKEMSNKGQAPRSIHYALSLIRQIWNQAVRDEVIEIQHPISKVTKPKVNNKRERFLTEEEEELLLNELAIRSPTTHDMAIMSIDTGARWSELARLKWSQVDLNAETVRLISTKPGNNRTAHIATHRVLEMLKRRDQERAFSEQPSVYLFPARNGGQQKQVNRVCYRTIKDLGLNNGIEDNSQRLSFHCFRHTCASRLAMAGVPLYTIKEIMGHHSITMTERYAHLMPSAMREALKILDKGACKVTKVENK
jgi:integrase